MTVTATLGDQSVSIKVTIKPKAVIGIDAGHQAHANYGLEAIGPGSSVKKIKVSGGTSGVYTGKPEYKLTLEVAKKLRKELIKRGYKVVMTRTTHNVNISNKQRALKLNKKCDISIRLHADGSTSSSVKGASVLYPSMSNPYLSNKICKKSRKLAQEILSSYCSATSISSRGLYTRDDLTGTNWSKIPVVLLEMGFMTNSSDDKYMSSKKGQKAIVKGIANGIDAYF
ncbi:MAG: N-acetylmuramoyl-L-alanine amidase [Eubacterium sp.]|nr:N-acetylmuramoyl-L-alanine amidase [Eubacterium sp.]